MRYKVVNEATARALAAQWKQAWGLTLEVVDHEQFWEVVLDGEHPMWRELNDWFVAGRMSVVR
jgi:hypothetical protein